MTSAQSTDPGIVPMRGDALEIRIIEAQRLSLQRTWRYRYEVIGGDLEGAVDWAISDLLLHRYTRYIARFNDDSVNPRIEAIQFSERWRSRPRHSCRVSSKALLLLGELDAQPRVVDPAVAVLPLSGSISYGFQEIQRRLSGPVGTSALVLSDGSIRRRCGPRSAISLNRALRRTRLAFQVSRVPRLRVLDP